MVNRAKTFPFDEGELTAVTARQRPPVEVLILRRPTTAHLERMAYALGLFPEGAAAVPVQVMEVLQDQWFAVVKASEPQMTYTKKSTS